MAGSALSRLTSTPWWSTPPLARAFVAAVVTAAVVLTANHVPTSIEWSTAGTFAVLALCAMANVELGRWAEGRRLGRDRTHKGLSAWPFAAALLLPLAACGLIAVIAYAHTRVRGMRIAAWKWNFSCGVVTLSAIAAGTVANHLPVHDGGVAGSGREFAATVAAIVVFVAVEATAFLAISRLNDAEDERHLRAHILSADFYVNELSVLMTATASVILFHHWAAFLMFTVPAYVWMQQAVLHRPLRDEANRDAKTSLLNYAAWHEAVTTIIDEQRGRRQPPAVAVMLVDLDNFKSINDTFGHLVGDQIIVAAARGIEACVRDGDFAARFGGDEFCVFMSDVDPSIARALADRVSAAVHAIEVSTYPARATASIGVATAQLDEHLTLEELVRRADLRLYEAKLAGRDRVAV